MRRSNPVRTAAVRLDGPAGHAAPLMRSTKEMMSKAHPARPARSAQGLVARTFAACFSRSSLCRRSLSGDAVSCALLALTMARRNGNCTIIDSINEAAPRSPRPLARRPASKSTSAEAAIAALITNRAPRQMRSPASGAEDSAFISPIWRSARPGSSCHPRKREPRSAAQSVCHRRPRRAPPPRPSTVGDGADPGVPGEGETKGRSPRHGMTSAAPVAMGPPGLRPALRTRSHAVRT
jgi:hypothetical protein